MKSNLQALTHLFIVLQDDNSTTFSPDVSVCIFHESVTCPCRWDHFCFTQRYESQRWQYTVYSSTNCGFAFTYRLKSFYGRFFKVQSKDTEIKTNKYNSIIVVSLHDFFPEYFDTVWFLYWTIHCYIYQNEGNQQSCCTWKW